jgi:hypothetical protein
MIDGRRYYEEMKEAGRLATPSESDDEPEQPDPEDVELESMLGKDEPDQEPAERQKTDMAHKPAPKCEECNKFFTSDGFLRRHMRQIHGADTDVDDAPAKEGDAPPHERKNKKPAHAHAKLRIVDADAPVTEANPGGYPAHLVIRSEEGIVEVSGTVEFVLKYVSGVAA